MNSFVNSRYRPILLWLLAVLCWGPARDAAAGDTPTPNRHLLYVVVPGIRNYLEFGGAGILVFDMDQSFTFVKRIATPASRVEKPENIKGVCVSVATGRLYFTTLTKLYCLDLVSEQPLWVKVLPGGCDRLSISPDGRRLYVPSFEGPHWNVVDGETGDLLQRIETGNGAHNTICSLDGTQVYLASLRTPVLSIVANVPGGEVLKTVGPFSAPIRPFTVNAAKTRCFVNVNGLLGFEIGDLVSGAKLARVEVEGFAQGKPKRHGCPSHGIGLTPDEREIWICDAVNRRLHVFDVTSEPPRQRESIALREEPGWVTFSLDGRFGFSSTGEIIDTQTKRIVHALGDEQGREVHSEKVVEIVFRGQIPVAASDQFGLGRKAVGSRQ